MKKKTASVFEGFLFLPMCIFTPSLAISLNNIFDPIIASDLEEKIPAPSSMYKRRQSLLQFFLNSEFKIAKIIAQNKKEIYKIINP